MRAMKTGSSRRQQDVSEHAGDHRRRLLCTIASARPCLRFWNGCRMSLGGRSLGAAMMQAFRAHLRPPCIGPASPALGLLLRPAAMQLPPAMQSARPLRSLAAWRPSAALGCDASLRHAWPPAGAASQLSHSPLGQLRGKGTQNAKKKKKEYARAKRDAYRAEAAAIAAAETEERQLALLSRVPPRALAAMQQQRALSAAQRRPPRRDPRLRAAPVAAPEAEAAAVAQAQARCSYHAAVHPILRLVAQSTAWSC